MANDAINTDELVDASVTACEAWLMTQWNDGQHKRWMQFTAVKLDISWSHFRFSVIDWLQLRLHQVHHRKTICNMIDSDDSTLSRYIINDGNVKSQWVETGGNGRRCGSPCMSTIQDGANSPNGLKLATGSVGKCQRIATGAVTSGETGIQCCATTGQDK